MVKFIAPILAGLLVFVSAQAAPVKGKDIPIDVPVSCIEVNHIVDEQGFVQASYVIFWQNVNGKPQIADVWQTDGQTALTKKGEGFWTYYYAEFTKAEVKYKVSSTCYRETTTTYDIEQEARKDGIWHFPTIEEANSGVAVLEPTPMYEPVYEPVCKEWYALEEYTEDGYVDPMPEPEDEWEDEPEDEPEAEWYAAEDPAYDPAYLDMFEEDWALIEDWSLEPVML